MSSVCRGNLYHAFAAHDTFTINIASEVGGYADASEIPNSGKVKRVDIRPTSSKLLFSNPKIRTLVIEMHSIFSDCHESLRTSGKMDNTDSLFLSQKYRSVLRSAADVDDLNDQNMRDATLWAIYECMFLKGGDTPISLDLIDWAHECFIFCHYWAKIASEDIENGVPFDEGNYWKAVAISLICCQFEECIAFLRLYKNDTAVRLFVEHLRKFDREWLAEESKISKYQAWQDSLKEMVEAKQLSSNRNIFFLARLLNGEDEVFSRCAEAVVSEWWHMMPFYVLTRYPTAPYNGLGEIAEECRQFFRKKEEAKSKTDDLDPFFAIFNLGDISVLQDLIANPWLSLHLVDTMFCSESCETPILKIRNKLLENYGATLMVNSNLWEIGASYLLHSGSSGKFRAESLICSMLIEDEDTAEKLLKICFENDLENAKVCIINTMTNNHLRQSSWASALTWALRLKHSKTLDQTVNTIVWKASEHEINNLGIVEHLSSDMILLSPSLSFLFSYYRYYKTLYTGDSCASSQILMELIASPDIPSNFHSILFGQLACILKEEDIPIPRETIYELLSFFKQYYTDHATEEDKDQEKALTLKQLLLMRLAQSIVS